MTRTLNELIADAKQELDDILKDEGGNPENIVYPEEIITDLADLNVPIYTSTLAELASDWRILQHENELGPAFDGSPTIPNIVATSIYEILTIELWDHWREIVDNWEDSQLEDLED